MKSPAPGPRWAPLSPARVSAQERLSVCLSVCVRTPEPRFCLKTGLGLNRMRQLHHGTLSAQAPKGGGPRPGFRDSLRPQDPLQRPLSLSAKTEGPPRRPGSPGSWESSGTWPGPSAAQAGAEQASRACALADGCQLSGAGRLPRPSEAAVQRLGGCVGLGARGPVAGPGRGGRKSSGVQESPSQRRRTQHPERCSRLRHRLCGRAAPLTSVPSSTRWRRREAPPRGPSVRVSAGLCWTRSTRLTLARAPTGRSPRGGTH